MSEKKYTKDIRRTRKIFKNLKNIAEKMSIRVKIRMSKIMRTYTNWQILHTLLSAKQMDTLKKLMEINI